MFLHLTGWKLSFSTVIEACLLCSCAVRDNPQNVMIRKKKLILNDMNINFGLVHSKKSN
jgi:hypothetical protein